MEWAGGAQRAIAAARVLSDQEGMEKAFAEVFRKLKDASI